MTLQCRCGWFVAYGCDQYTSFGSAPMIEPPDPVLLCGECAETVYGEVLRHLQGTPSPHYHLPWRPSQAHFRAVRDAGWVLARPRMAAWVEAFKKGHVKDGYTEVPFDQYIRQVAALAPPKQEDE